jgi:hypothetical protein
MKGEYREITVDFRISGCVYRAGCQLDQLFATGRALLIFMLMSCQTGDIIITTAFSPERPTTSRAMIADARQQRRASASTFLLPAPAL